MRLAFVGVALLVVLARTAPADESRPVALALEVSGPVAPPVESYSEIPDGTQLSLGGDGRVAFVHYPSCRLVAIRGGTVTFDGLAVEVDGGQVEREAEQDCPQRIEMQVAGVASGVRMRAISTDTLPTRPACVLVGERAGAFAAARILAGEEEVATVPVEGNRIAWPNDLPPLQARRLYQLVLVPRTEGEPIAAAFSSRPGGEGGAPPCVLRVD